MLDNPRQNSAIHISSAQLNYAIECSTFIHKLKANTMAANSIFHFKFTYLSILLVGILETFQVTFF